MSKRKLEPSEHFVAGTLAGLVSTVALFPLDTIKVRYQVDETTTLRSPQRLFAAFQTVVRNEGWQVSPHINTLAILVQLYFGLCFLGI